MEVFPALLSVLSVFALWGQPTTLCLDLCDGYPDPDPCLPGGVWDPLMKRCKGYGLLPCYQCYSGDLCETIEDPVQCGLEATSGNPIYIAEYWIYKHSKVTEPCLSTPAHYRPAYLESEETVEEFEGVITPLRTAIDKLHSITGNAETDGYSLVAGMGATMVIHLAVSALSQRILKKCHNESRVCPDVVDVFVQTPHYNLYQDIVEYVPNTRWNTSADPKSVFTLEILTYPNNPNGARRSPLVTDPSRVIWDMVYYWPMYTNVDSKLSQPLMIFSSSKHGGLAGSRFGWGLVKEKQLAKEMMDVLEGVVLTLSIDIQLRVLNSLEAILSEANNTVLPFHLYGQQVIASRFKQLSDILSSCPGLSLTNQLMSTGAYAWISCSSDLGSCDSIFQRVNLRGANGEVYGGTKNEIRFSMMLPSVEFNIMYIKIKALCGILVLIG